MIRQYRYPRSYRHHRYTRYTWYDYGKYERKARRREYLEHLFRDDGPLMNFIAALIGGLLFGGMIGWGLLFT